MRRKRLACTFVQRLDRSKLDAPLSSGYIEAEPDQRPIASERFCWQINLTSEWYSLALQLSTILPKRRIEVKNDGGRKSFTYKLVLLV